MSEFENGILELNKWFPRTPVTPEKNKEINPEKVLPSLKDLENARKAFEGTWEYWRLLNLKNVDSKKGKAEPTYQLIFSDLEKILPAINRAFKIPQLSRNITKHRHIPNAPLVGSILHEAVPLSDFSRTNEAPDKISSYFPTSKKRFKTPYIEVMSNSASQDFSGRWEDLQGIDRYVHKLMEGSKEWFGRDLPKELEPHVSPEEEITVQKTIRRSPEVKALAGKIASYEQTKLETDKGESQRRLFELTVITNFEKLSPKTKSRLSIIARYDEIDVFLTKKGNRFFKNSDLKTGEQELSDAENFQALLMDYLTGYFSDWNRKHELENIEQPYITNRFKDPVPKSRNYSLTYVHFNLDTGEIEEVPVENSGDQREEIFLPWLAFYSDVIVAFKSQINDYLAGKMKELTPHYDVQNELPLIYDSNGGYSNTLHLGNLGPARPKPEIYDGPRYVFGVSESEVICEKCGKHMTQVCHDLMNLGGTKISFTVQTYCQGHYHDSQRIRNISSEALIRPDIKL
ncbi:MAG TPA: hypothetical protein VLE44_02770 [Candidatus Saccharimonadales bacterium]|nr:hypothetical protein [Candidatus Saccharimonadales bacterium]